MAEQMVSARVTLNPYANKVLGILKLQHDLRDKSEALNKFIDMYGDNIVDQQASEKYTKEVIQLADKHFKNYGNKKMSQEELGLLFEE